MNRKLQCILLVDDDDMTNFYNKKMIEKVGFKGVDIKVVINGREALDFLEKKGDFENDQTAPPGIIFLDINMPGMNGWEFLEGYHQIPQSKKADIVIAMLTTSLNPDDEQRAAENEYIHDFYSKPLSPEMIRDLVAAKFPETLQ